MLLRRVVEVDDPYNTGDVCCKAGFVILRNPEGMTKDLSFGSCLSKILRYAQDDISGYMIVNHRYYVTNVTNVTLLHTGDVCYAPVARSAVMFLRRGAEDVAPYNGGRMISAPTG